MPFYAVARGRETGIYPDWNSCKDQVHGFADARYQKFDSRTAALEFIRQHSDNGPKTAKCVPKTAPQARGRLLKDSGPARIVAKNGVVYEKTGNFIHVKKPKDAALPSAVCEQCDSVAEVYTDGACESNGKRGARAGIGVYWGPGHHLNFGGPLVGARQTNNCAEIHAAIKALEQAKENSIHCVRILTDSKFMIQSVEDWMPAWKRRGWMTSNGAPVKNKDDFVKLDLVSQGMNVTWKHVRGHRGIHGNEEADRLAVEGAKMAR